MKRCNALHITFSNALIHINPLQLNGLCYPKTGFQQTPDIDKFNLRRHPAVLPQKRIHNAALVDFSKITLLTQNKQHHRDKKRQIDSPP